MRHAQSLSRCTERRVCEAVDQQCARMVERESERERAREREREREEERERERERERKRKRERERERKRERRRRNVERVSLSLTLCLCETYDSWLASSGRNDPSENEGFWEAGWTHPGHECVCVCVCV